MAPEIKYSEMFILFHGPDEFTAHEELSHLRETHDFAYNQDTYSGSETSFEVIRATCDTMPFLSEQRLVVVEGLPKRKRSGKGDSDDAEESNGGPQGAEATKPSSKGKKGKASGSDPRQFAQDLAHYVPQIPETTILALLVEEPLKEGDPLLRAAQQHGRVVTCTPPRGGQLEDWLKQRAKARHAQLEPEAAKLLATEVGDNLRLLAGEIDKLCTYVGDGGKIHAQDVRLLTPASRQTRVFDLTDALARRDRSRALLLLHELLAAGESPLGIVALTAYQTRTLLQVKSLADRGLRAPQIAQAAGIAPFIAEKSLTLTRQFTIAQLEAAHRTLLDVDIALKRSRMTPEMALDLLVIEFGMATR